MIDLSGEWRAGAVDPAHTDLGPDAVSIAVPGHWRSEPTFADQDGPIRYHRRFDSPIEPSDRNDQRWWLQFDGIFYESDVWLDGTYIGDTEGYFFPQQFEVTDALATRSEHDLTVDVTCSRPTDRSAKRNLTGVFQHEGDSLVDGNPGGIWRPVRLVRSGPVRIRHSRAVCLEADDDGAVILMRCILDAADTTDITLVTTLSDTTTKEHRRLASGENRVEWRLVVEAPELWWPHSLGDQPLFDLCVDAVLPDGTCSDRRRRRIGLRTIRRHGWVFEINGEPLFLKGADVAPTKRALADATDVELEADVRLAIDAGLDLVRVRAHITRPEFYDAADTAGLLIWQDLPLYRGYARGIRKQARRQAREAVDLLGTHPSIIAWCGHDEPVGATSARRLAAHLLPTWNKTVLDNSLRRVLEQNDPTRPVIPHSGVLPHPPLWNGTDSHLSFGWQMSDDDDFPRFLDRWPRMARFISAFGAQSVPDDADFCNPDQWPDLDWEHLERSHGLEKRTLDRHVPAESFDSFADWRSATQDYQARLIARQIEEIRRRKYAPTGGFLHSLLADAHPAVSRSVLDHNRLPKPGLAALRAACRPVIVVADGLPATVKPGTSLDIAVHVVNDLHRDLGPGLVTATLHQNGHDRDEDIVREFGGEVAADSVVLAGSLEIEAPLSPGSVRLELKYRNRDHPDLTADNCYVTAVR